MPFGDVLLARLPFADGQGFKTRPLLVVHEHVDNDLLVAPITSHPSRGAADTPLRDWQAAGLRLPSTARMDKLGTVAGSVIVKTLGKLTGEDNAEARKSLRRFLSLVVGE